MSEQNVMEGAPEFAGEAFENDFEADGFEGAAEGDSQNGGQPAPGTGQSKSSRRRRRKRKKAAGTASPGTAVVEGGDMSDGTASAAPLVMEGESLALAATPPQQLQRRANNNNGSNSNGSSGFQRGPNNQGQNSQGQGDAAGQGKRWKKKLRDRERRGPGGGDGRSDSSNNGGGGFGGERSFRRQGGGRPDNFGNLIGQQQGSRKGKSQGSRERGFVGPMDHSYRDASADFGDAPPSTIQMRGRHGRRHFGDNQPIDHNAPRPIPIPEDAQTHIYLFVEDLFISAKVQETARKLGVKVAFLKNEKDAIAELTSGEAENKPALIVFDLNNAAAKPLTLIPKLKAKLKRSASIVGFLSSIQGDLKAKAMEAGCDTVMPKAAFSQTLPNLLRRYGAEDAEEVNYNY